MTSPNPKSVQEYLDETPFWPDGTPVSDVPMAPMQWRIWWLAAAGKFFEGMVVFMTGVAMPLINWEFHLTELDRGMVGAAVLFGILIGASVLGGLADHFGRKLMFIAEMALFTLFLILVALSPNVFWLVIFLFGLGLALGCDYPTAHMIISESIPTNFRGRLVLSAFGFQAVGALAGTAVGFIILKTNVSASDWRWMYAFAIIPALIVLAGRFFIPQSVHWLVEKGRVEEAEREMLKLLCRNPAYPRKIVLNKKLELQTDENEKVPSLMKLFKKKSRRATILASVPWFLQDLGTYGIGIFTPTILAATIGMAHGAPRNLTDLIYQDMLSAKGAAAIDALLIFGIIAAIYFADRFGRIHLQIAGFIGCAVGLALAAYSTHFDGSMKMILIFSGFMIFNFMTNMGPNAMTYLLAGEVFPTKIRGVGAGFTASFAKMGAVLTAFLFPILLKDIGTQTLLLLLVGASLIGAWVTWVFRIETNGISMEKLGAD